MSDSDLNGGRGPSRDLERSDFEEVWPGMRRDLDRVLASRGVRPDQREDILQETGLRLYRKWESIDHGAPVFRLAVTIALNLMRDQFRRGRHEIIGDVPEKPSSIDVERAGLAKVEFLCVTRAMKELSADHRDALLGGVTESQPLADRSRSAVKMLRFRARKRLTALLEATSAVIFGTWARLARSASEHVPELSAGAVALASALVTAPLVPPPSVVAPPAPPARVAQVDLVEIVAPRTAPVVFESEAGERPVTSTEPAPKAESETNDPGSRGVKVAGQDTGAEADFEVGGTRIEVRDTGGPVPICIEGEGINPLPCPEEGNRG